MSNFFNLLGGLFGFYPSGVEDSGSGLFPELSLGVNKIIALRAM